MKNVIATVASITLIALAAVPTNALANHKKDRAVTNWLVMFNDPTACATAPCTEADIFLAGNPAKVSICYVTGQVVRANGRATFAGRFAEGSNYGCFYPDDPDPYGLEDADTTEIHVVAQEHGAALRSGHGLEDQVAYFMGRCNPKCTDTQFAVHWSDSDPSVPVFRFKNGSRVRGAVSTLYREGTGIRVILHTRLRRIWYR